MLVYVICYGAAMLFAFSAHFTLSGMSLLLAAVYLCLESGKLQTGNPLSAYIEQGKQPAQMERVSTLSVFSQIEIDLSLIHICCC